MSFDEINDAQKKSSPITLFLFVLLILISVLIGGMIWTLFYPELTNIPQGVKQLFNSL